jgi:predicted DNA-binding antitoxin AbrB/MazE fold protein
MGLEIEATYENGVLKLDRPLPLQDQQRVRITIHPPGGLVRQSYGLIKWTGSLEDLEYLAESADNDPAERFNDIQ